MNSDSYPVLSPFSISTPNVCSYAAPLLISPSDIPKGISVQTIVCILSAPLKYLSRSAGTLSAVNSPSPLHKMPIHHHILNITHTRMQHESHNRIPPAHDRPHDVQSGIVGPGIARALSPPAKNHGSKHFGLANVSASNDYHCRASVTTCCQAACALVMRARDSMLLSRISRFTCRM